MDERWTEKLTRQSDVKMERVWEDRDRRVEGVKRCERRAESVGGDGVSLRRVEKTVEEHTSGEGQAL